jgi:hypothetical protein
MLENNLLVGQLEMTAAHSASHLTAHTGKVKKLHSLFSTLLPSERNGQIINACGVLY